MCNWDLSTEVLYGIVGSKYKELTTKHNSIIKNHRKINDEHKDHHKEEPFSVIKFMGDGIMMFFETKVSDGKSYGSDYSSKSYDDFEKELSSEVYTTVKKIESEVLGNSKYLEDMRLKVVVCYLTNVLTVETNGVKDVIGRGIDFAFRLEKFAGATHHIYNSMFYYLVKDNDTAVSDDFREEYVSIEVSRKMKGWDDPQSFFVITNHRLKMNHVAGNLNDSIKDSPFDNDVKTNLLIYLYGEYIKLREEKEKLEKQKSDPKSVESLRKEINELRKIYLNESDEDI